MSFVSTGKQITRTLKNAGRLRVIVGVFARHGFYKLAERINLGKFLVERLTTGELEELSVPVRMRKSFEELGPTFIKLGQLLATRPDLVPEAFVEEFSNLHDKVQPLPFQVIEETLKLELGSDYRKHFLSIEETPIGSASIAQVHRAQLLSGQHVVIKVQRPGIIQTINDDLGVLYFIAELLEKYIDEVRTFNPVSIVDEYFKSLELETNFVVEANNIRRFRENFKDQSDIRIPEVFLNLLTERVLVMEEIIGIPLSQPEALYVPGIDRDQLLRNGLRAYLKMVFADGLFHGDLHAGNFLVMPNNQIGLIDFGMVGRLNHRTQTAIASMLIALSKEDYERVAFEYVDLAPFSEKVNVDLFAKDLRDLIAPYYGLTLKDMNLGRILLASSSIATKYHIRVPTELMLFFKSLVSIEGMGRKVKPDFDFLQHSIEFAAELIKHQYDPGKMMQDLTSLSREAKSFLSSLPRQLNFLLRKMNSPDHAIQIQVKELKDLKKSVETSFNLLFLGVIIASLILSSSVIYVYRVGSYTAGMPTLSFTGFLLSGILGFIAFVNYIKK